MAKKLAKVKKIKKDKINQILKSKCKELDGSVMDQWTANLDTMSGEEAEQHLINLIKAK